ncbi:hypothetical protein LNV08_15155 [Paucibacter sp. TC2R-5]|uniref:hypothetical protein n=1 Tax=Paucibacter sp. TC2R-5 TaxID=2893555 RepID=UPI0021E3A67A|nr:hypothetical protein [Paucibacter sp. TC2R-5]MCV2360313.1 hypothetical protein [Paucibacter sp. TC2R-5]
MLYAISWFAVLSLIGLWSFAAWAFHALTQWGLSTSGDWSGATAPEGFNLQEILGPWLPPDLAQALTALLASLKPLFESLLSFAPALGSGLSFLVWLVWGLGCFLLLIVGAALHAMIAVMRRRTTIGNT